MILSSLLLFITALMGSYLLGSFSSAIIVCKLTSLPDPRDEGSGNPGATNVLRLGGKKLAIIVLLGDALKGVIPVVIMKLFLLPDFFYAWLGFAAFIGHLYPICFRFHGGKGVATCLGVLLALNWPLGLAVAGTWLVIAVIFRYSSLASLIAFVLAPLYSFFITPHASYAYYIAIVLMCIMLIIRHSGNIKRLLNGKESRIGAKLAAENNN